MNSLNVILCISGIYIGMLQGYPIEDLNDVSLGTDHTTKYGTTKSSLPSPQISRLIDIYNNLVQTNHNDFINDLIYDAHDQTDSLKTSDDSLLGNIYLKASDDVLLHDDFTKSADDDVAKQVNSVVNIFDSNRSKRQQGWYIQYGKRNEGTSSYFSTKGLDRQRTNNQNRNYNDNTDTVSLPSLLFPLQLQNRFSAARTPSFTSNALPDDDADNFNVTDELKIEQMQKGQKLEFDDSENESGTEKSKRQQGWFISYGKRGGDGLKLYFL